MLHVICNPTAGNGRAKKIGIKVQEILKERAIPFKYTETTHPGHATELAKAAVSQGIDTVLSVGGDGTSYEIACGLNGTKTALGIIPAGTGNDFIKTLKYPSDPLKALDHALSCPPQPTDTGMMADRLFLNEIGTGFDALALSYAAQAKKYCKGLLPYLFGVLCAIFRSKPIRLTYQLDNEPPVTTDALVCGVANGGIIGGGMKIAPEASVDDGLFDVVIVRYIERWRLPPYLIKLLQGKILSFPETVFARASRVSFSAPDMIVNMDGELVEMDQVSLTMSKGTLLIHR